MNSTLIVFQAMKADAWLDYKELSAKTELSENTCRSALRSLEKSELVECNVGRYKRGRKYRSKQMNLFNVG